ncbi:MAG: NAD(P)-dependent oxidoreductase, partial [Longicatena caecimuris]|uniref:NAD(P)-dependent oxidoreductase n=1 Tax=Longicatena caecimuris TaxID=1796635 RepID=UPI00399A0AE1
LHLPVPEATYPIINQARIAMRKDGVILINTARGALIDNEALIKGIEKGKIQGAAFDVVEGETGIYYQKQKGRVLPSREMLLLNSYPNVILSPHMAFLTDDSNRDMVYHSMESCLAFMEGEEDAMRIL